MPVREQYIDITDFMSRCGGSYSCLDTQTCRDLIEALFDNRVRVTRDEKGSITSTTVWWMIHESDLEIVKNGGHPSDVSNGSIVYVADHAGEGAYPELIRFIKQNIGKKGVCWHHRYKHPTMFRYYPHKEGVKCSSHGIE